MDRLWTIVQGSARAPSTLAALTKNKSEPEVPMQQAKPFVSFAYAAAAVEAFTSHRVYTCTDHRQPLRAYKGYKALQRPMKAQGVPHPQPKNHLG